MVEVLLYRRKLVPLPVERLVEIPTDPYLAYILRKYDQEQLNNSLDRDKAKKL